MLNKAQDTPPQSPNQIVGMDDDYDLVELNEDDVEEVDEDDLLAAVEGDESEEERDGMEELASSAPIRDDSDYVFTKHTGSVFCCHLDPKNGNLAVTGAEDEKAFVWEIQGGQILFECTGHKDSVMAVQFSHDGAYLATADMSGIVQVWKVATQAVIWTDNIGDVSWLKWHHGTNVLLCAAASGEVYMWKMPHGECKMLSGHGEASECGEFMPDGRRAAIGYSDGCVKIFDLKTAAVQASVSAGDAHTAAVASIDLHSDNNLILTGGGDGKVSLIKTQPFKVIARFSCDNSGGSEWVEAVGFCKDSTLQLAAAGTLSGKLYIWDIAKQTLRHKIEQESGISRLIWDVQSPIIYAGCLDGAIRIFDARSGKLQSELLGHFDHVLDISLSTDGNTLLSAGDDKTARVFSINTPDR